MTETDITETDMTETKYRQFLDRTMELNDLPGIVIGLSLRGERWIGAAGYRDMERKEPIRPGDIFNCASVSKLLTSTAVLKLIDAGALGYDDRLCDVLPDLKFADERAKEIRIWQMLSHTSGIGDIEDYRWEEALTSNQALRDYIYSEEVVSRLCSLSLERATTGTATSLTRYWDLSLRSDPLLWARACPMRTLWKDICWGLRG